MFSQIYVILIDGKGGTMNRDTLEAYLSDLPVSKIHYCLCGGLPDEKLCIEERADGTWQVYYSERGHRQNPKIFSSEDEACRYMAERLKRYAGKG